MPARLHVRPMGCIVRVDGLARSRKIPTRKVSPLFAASRHAAVDRGHLAIVTELLKHGADPEALITDTRETHDDAGERREAINFTPMGVNLFSSGPPHARCTPMRRTCGA